ncbi:MAG: 50S ribosomal protein L9 [Verrucomicrobia bacterium]|nr:MAG: 50S ribosomal protein L9 [Verrucomicrobiota bacterium]
MAKTEVILVHNIVGLGGESDHVKVAAGYARNYLFPQGLAIPVTAANKRRLEALKQRRAEREAHELNSMTELAKSLSKLTCIIAVKTGEDGKLFGAVTSGMIADQLKTQFEATLDKRKIHLEHPIRALGEYDVELRLHHDVTTTLKVRVESTTPVAAPAPEAEAKKEEPRTEKRGRRPEGAEHRPGRPDRADKGEKADKPERHAGPDRRPRPPGGGHRPPRAEKSPRPEKSPKSDESPKPAEAPKAPEQS